MANAIDETALETLFLDARTHSAWSERPIDASTLRRVYELARMAPTSANCSPMRIVFVTSRDAKDRLCPLLMEGNREKTMTAPSTAIIGYDTEFYRQLPRLFPHGDAMSWFEGPENAERAADTAFRNGSLQGAYFILAARALGLDCGPMSGFDDNAVDREFFPSGKIKSNFLCNLGYGDPARLHPRCPRFTFDEVCSII
jgi:3-hydroxypropanoate dehydrogenase